MRGWYLGEFGLAKILLNKDRLTLELNGEVMPLKASGKAGYIGQDESGEPHLAVSFLGTESRPAAYLMIDTWCYKRIAEAGLSLPDPSLCRQLCSGLGSLCWYLYRDLGDVDRAH